MKKTVFTFGSIAGIIVTAMMIFSTISFYNDPNFEGNMLVGYAGQLAAFAFIFVGIKTYRDKYHEGSISFGKAFRIGLYIALIASTFYVAAWLIEYYFFIPDFWERYVSQMIEKQRTSGASEAKIQEMEDSMAMWGWWYQNPLGVVAITYFEILPLGIVVSLIAALILKRRSTQPVAGHSVM